MAWVFAVLFVGSSPSGSLREIGRAAPRLKQPNRRQKAVYIIADVYQRSQTFPNPSFVLSAGFFAAGKARGSHFLNTFEVPPELQLLAGERSAYGRFTTTTDKAP